MMTPISKYCYNVNQKFYFCSGLYTVCNLSLMITPVSMIKCLLQCKPRVFLQWSIYSMQFILNDYAYINEQMLTIMYTSLFVVVFSVVYSSSMMTPISVRSDLLHWSICIMQFIHNDDTYINDQRLAIM